MDVRTDGQMVYEPIYKYYLVTGRRRDSTLRSMKAALVGTLWFATAKTSQTQNLRFTAWIKGSDDL
jgi:hypothetical protein